MKDHLAARLLMSASIAILTASTLVMSTIAKAQIVPLPGTILNTDASVQANAQSQTGLPPLQVTDPNPCTKKSCQALANAFADGPGSLEGTGTAPGVTALSITTGTSNPNQAIAALTYYFIANGPSTENVNLIIAGSVSSTPNVNRPFVDGKVVLPGTSPLAEADSSPFMTSGPDPLWVIYGDPP
jgi:hypothetical protein